MMCAEESTSWPGVSRPVHLRRPRASPTSGTWAGCTTCSTTRSRIRCTASGITTRSPSRCSTPSASASCCRSRTTRSCTASARCSTRCRATCGRSTPTCARCTATCSRTRARSCCSWAARSASGASGTTTGSSTGRCSATRAHAGLQRWVRDLNRTYARSRRCGRSTSSRRGFSWIDCNDHENSVISLMRRGARTSGTSPWRSSTSRRCRGTGYRIGVPAGGAYRELLNSDAVALRRQQRRQRGPRRIRGHPLARPSALAVAHVPPLGFLLLKPNK